MALYIKSPLQGRPKSCTTGAKRGENPSAKQVYIYRYAYEIYGFNISNQRYYYSPSDIVTKKNLNGSRHKASSRNYTRRDETRCSTGGEKKTQKKKKRTGEATIRLRLFPWDSRASFRPYINPALPWVLEKVALFEPPVVGEGSHPLSSFKENPIENALKQNITDFSSLHVPRPSTLYSRTWEFQLSW